MPVEEIDAPNVYVSVTLINKGARRLPDFRQGYVKLAVRPDALKLDVEVTLTPPRSRPGQDVKLDVQVRDTAGRRCRASSRWRWWIKPCWRWPTPTRRTSLKLSTGSSRWA